MRRQARRMVESSPLTAMLALLLLAAPIVLHAEGFAGELRAKAAQLSDTAFRLLSSINTDFGKQASPILAPVASVAGDAQTLSAALNADDRAAASRAMAAILSDRAQINSLAA